MATAEIARHAASSQATRAVAYFRSKAIGSARPKPRTPEPRLFGDVEHVRWSGRANDVGSIEDFRPCGSFVISRSRFNSRSAHLRTSAPPGPDYLCA